MKKLSALFVLLILGFSAFAQSKADGHQTAINKSGMDIVILEMNLSSVLGGYKNGKFVDSKTASKSIKIGDEYTLFDLDFGKNNSTLEVTKLNDPDLDICPEYFSVKTNKEIRSGVAFSSDAGWNAIPRIPKMIDPKNIVYQGIIRKYIRTKGIKNPNVVIKKILKVDLEGDGQDEVIIHASNRPDITGYDTKFGDYSFILLRKIVKGKVENIKLAGEFITKNTENDIPYNFDLSAIVDLDGDGKMEIVTNGDYFEGAWVEAFQIKDGKANKILETGCGV